MSSSRRQSTVNEQSSAQQDDGTGDDGNSSTSSFDDNQSYCTIIYNGLKKSTDENEPITNVKEILEEELKDLQLLKTKYDEKSIDAELDGNVDLVQRAAFTKLYKDNRNKILQQLTNLKEVNTDEKDVKLPKLNVPKFSGTQADWLTFRNIFTTVIHNSSITKLKKNTYLHSYLEGEALSLIKNLDIAENTYDECWDIINLHYNDPHQQVSSHLSALLHQPSMEKRASLKQIIGSFRQNFAAFQSIVKEHNLDAISEVMISLFLSKTSKDLRGDWEKEVSLRNRFSTFNEFLQYMESQSNAIERSNPSSSMIKPRAVVMVATGDQESKKYCFYCKKPGNHFIHQCESFLKLDQNSRNSYVRKSRLCARCLRRKCNSSCNKFSCRICRRPHNTLIHCDRPSSVTNQNSNSLNRENTDEPPVKISKDNNNSDSYKSLSFQESAKFPILALQTFGALNIMGSLLSTITVQIGHHYYKALLDSGSQFNFITERLRTKLNLPKTKSVHQAIQGVGGLFMKGLMTSTNILVKSIHTSYKLSLECLVIDKLIDYLPNDYFSIESWNIPPHMQLADPTFNIPSEIDLLIGSNIFWKLLGNSKYSLQNNLPELRDTRFGWIVTGQVTTNTTTGSCNLIYNESKQICDLLERFWDTETLKPEKREWTAEEKSCEALFLQTTKHLPCGRFIVHLPFKENPNEIGESRDSAIRRFHFLEKRLQKNPSLKERYAACLQEYIDLNHMKEVIPLPGQSMYYIPHHAVIKEESSTTKLRVVFDASMKTTNKKSLNDILMTGPVVQSELISILMRFRTHKYVFTTDITKMYRQIRVITEHSMFQCILWRNSPTEPLKTYALNTVTFGVSSSPYQATRCLTYLAETEKIKYPLAYPVLLKDTYIDDIISGGNTISETLKIQEQLKELVESAGLPLSKWSANHPSLLEQIPDSQREKLKILSLGGETGITTLGMCWLPKEDEIFVKIKDIEGEVKTKRQLLGKISSIYDPLGLIGPITIIARLLMQLIWSVTIDQKTLDWDDAIPDNILDQWKVFSSQLNLLSQIRIPRYLFTPEDQFFCELHGFADASEQAYGAVVYIKSVDIKGNVNIKLISSKSRVASLKKISIPRLELCAALLLSELINKVIEAFYNLQFTNIRLWSDSTVALYWIHTPSYKLETYEANRVQKIQNSTKNFQWDYVKSEHNPADIISHGLLPQQLLQSHLWWNGPDWLKTSIKPWPREMKFTPSDNPTQIGIKKIKNIVGITVISNPIFTRFSNFDKLIRVTAYMLRFCVNTRVRKRSLGNGPIGVRYRVILCYEINPSDGV
ncbi:uncharacterized protein LOC135840671 [Planococcus citri]|uniref:uncharacterized protein LOC135840671 n=1 Tax=Planococcus citri TaxID=170843 RepID=UPI0031F85D5F